MSKGQQELSARRSSEPKYPINPEAFAFLELCGMAGHDLTSAEPLDPSSTGIMPPQKILTLMGTVDFRNFTEVRGTSRGEPETLDACLQFFEARGISCSQEQVSLNNNILSSIEAVLLNRKSCGFSKVLLPTPTFGYYLHQLKQNGMEFEFLPTRKEDGFLPNRQDLEQKIIESGAKTLLLCYPNNPTGVVMTEACARMIADVTERHGVFVISDEAFMNNSLSGAKHFPIAAVEGMVERSFSVTNAAKSIFTGRKTSFCVGPKDVVSIFDRLGGYPTKQDQKIMVASIEASQENVQYLETCRQYYMQNIQTIGEKIAQLNHGFNQQFGSENVQYVKPLVEHPDTTNIYLLDFSGLRGKQRGDKVMQTGLDASKWLLEDASVGTVPGECFLIDEKEMVVRISLNHSQEKIIQAFDSMIAATSKIHAPSATMQQTSGAQLANNSRSATGGVGVV